MQNHRNRIAVSGWLTTLTLLFAPISALAQAGTTFPDLEPGCASLMVLDFVTDAEGKALAAGDAVADHYRLWGIDVAAWNTTGTSVATVAEMPTTTGPRAALQIGSGQAGTVSFVLHNLVSVLAIELIGTAQDGTQVLLYDQNSQVPATVPVTPSKANVIRALALETLDAVTRVDVVLTEGSGVAALYLCPLSSPKLVPKHNFPSVTVDATISRAELGAGETADVAVTVANTGYSVGYDLTLTQQLPPGLVFADDGSRERTWDLGAIGAKGSFTVGYQLMAEGGAAPAAVPTYVTAFISNGRGNDGVGSDRLEVALTTGAVLGTGTTEPVPPPEPVTPTVPVPPPEPVAPAEPLPAPTPEPEASPTPVPPEPEASPTPVETPKPSTTPAQEPIGGPEETPRPVTKPEAMEPKEQASPEASPESPFDGTLEGEPPLTPVGGGDLATATATTTPGLLASCTSWLGLLAVLNAGLITMLAIRERKAAKEGGSRWVIAMLVAAVPLIIWYPACELNWWLALTAAGVGALLYSMRPRGGSSGEITPPPGGMPKEPSAPPPPAAHGPLSPPTPMGGGPGMTNQEFGN